MQIYEINLWADVAPASAAGTYTMAAADDSGNNLLSAATFDLETLLSDTQTTVTLTATTADLQLTAAEWAVFTFTSNNADLTLTDLNLTVLFAAQA